MQSMGCFFKRRVVVCTGSDTVIRCEVDQVTVVFYWVRRFCVEMGNFDAESEVILETVVDPVVV